MTDVTFVCVAVPRSLGGKVTDERGARRPRGVLDAPRYRDGGGNFERLDGSGHLLAGVVVTSAGFDVEGHGGRGFKHIFAKWTGEIAGFVDLGI
jgi:hypothetical protein